MNSIDARPTGLVLSVGELAPHFELFTRGFGLVETERAQLGSETVERLYGVADRTANWVRLETEGTGVGVDLVCFEPNSPVVVRESARGIDRDALKVIDFMVEPYAEAHRQIEALGGRFDTEPAEYEVPGLGRFTEGHLDGPDAIKCALLEMHPNPDGSSGRAEYCRLNDRVFSEIVGFSSPVRDLETVGTFYRQVFGFEEVLRYDFESEAFGTMIGLDRAVHLTGVNYGSSRRDPMIGLIDYGLPEGMDDSLAERAVFPHRGLLSVRIAVRSVDEVCERAAVRGDRLAAEPVTVELGAVSCRTALVAAPHGVLHQCFEQVNEKGSMQ